VKPLPDPYPIEPLTKPPNCTITVPGSKSITNRALILAALAKGKCTLRGALWADDTQVMVDSLQKLGFEVTVEPDPNEEYNRTITVVGRDGEIPAKKAELYVGNAGTAARFLTALVCLGHGEYKISGDPRMHERPMAALFNALRELGAKIDSQNNHLPATIISKGLHGHNVNINDVFLGKAVGQKVKIDLSETTQFASALWLIWGHVEGMPSLNLANRYEQDGPYGYFAMTTKLGQDFRPDPLDPVYIIEPDLSSGSYFVAAEYITSGKLESKVQVLGWPQHPPPYVGLQIDSQFPRILKETPEKVSRIVDLGDSILTLAICALFWEHPLRISDAARLRLQETDRTKAMVTELRRIGARAEVNEDENGFTVWPAESGQLHGAEIETYNDHRMAMCFSVLGLKVPGIRIKNPQCVSKTFPNFFEKLEQLRQ
jgi:3-phosphoshikimate 1-carboxyvinyltransferase